MKNTYFKIHLIAGVVGCLTLLPAHALQVKSKGSISSNNIKVSAHIDIGNGLEGDCVFNSSEIEPRTYNCASLSISGVNRIVSKASGSGPLIIKVLGNAHINGTVLLSGMNGENGTSDSKGAKGGIGVVGGSNGGSCLNLACEAEAGKESANGGGGVGGATHVGSYQDVGGGGGGGAVYHNGSNASVGLDGVNPDQLAKYGKGGKTKALKKAQNFDVSFNGGSGGGAGGAGEEHQLEGGIDKRYAGGGGGAGGGAIQISAGGLISMTGSLISRGGNGGNGEVLSGGGGGGSGGAVWLQSMKAIQLSGNIDVSGGKGGKGGVKGGGRGGNGGDGIVLIQENLEAPNAKNKLKKQKIAKRVRKLK